MVKTGKWIAKHRILIVLIGILLLIPSVIGTIKTRINYDILSYLPESLETVKGQDVMVDEFGTGAFSMVVVEDMPLKDVQKLKNKGLPVATGVFQADMQVALVNDGPVTFMLEKHCG